MSVLSFWCDLASSNRSISQSVLYMTGMLLFSMFTLWNLAKLCQGSEGDGWLSWQRACLIRQLSGFESVHLLKIQNGWHKQKSGQHTLARQKGTGPSLVPNGRKELGSRTGQQAGWNPANPRRSHLGCKSDRRELLEYLPQYFLEAGMQQGFSRLRLLFAYLLKLILLH